MDLVFELKDLIYICTTIVGVVIGWQQLKSHNEKQDIAMKNNKEIFDKEIDLLKQKVKHIYENNDKDHRSYEDNMNSIKSDIHKVQQDIALMQQSLEMMKQGQTDMMKLLIDKK